MSMSPCLHVHVSMSPFLNVSLSHFCVYIFPCLHLHVSMSFCFPEFRKTENGTNGNSNFCLFAENGNGELPFVCCKRKQKAEICFLCKQTMNSNRRLLFQQRSLSMQKGNKYVVKINSPMWKVLRKEVDEKSEVESLRPVSLYLKTNITWKPFLLTWYEMLTDLVKCLVSPTTQYLPTTATILDQGKSQLGGF